MKLIAASISWGIHGATMYIFFKVKHRKQNTTQEMKNATHRYKLV
jgi:hypothetical protein